MSEQAQTVGGVRANEKQVDTSKVNTGRNSNRMAHRSNGTKMQNGFEGNTLAIGGILSLPAESHIKEESVTPSLEILCQHISLRIFERRLKL